MLQPEACRSAQSLMSQNSTMMTPLERRASISLASIYMLRMIGMFLILPVFSVLARELPDATPFKVGLAISAYGLTQAIFQVPFGMWSDRWGRKPVICVGLILFIFGSVVAALSSSIYGIIAGRCLQGAGAVAAVVMALAADLTREEHRTKAMAMIGISIGVSFAISIVAGPVLSNWLGLQGLFWLITALAVSSLLVLFVWVPNPEITRFHSDAQLRATGIGRVFSNPELLRLDFGIFCLHLMLTASFVVVPVLIRDQLGMPASEHWYIYLPVFLLAILTMVPFVILAEKKRKMKPVFLAFIALVGIALTGFVSLGTTFWGVFFLLYLFFTGFNLLEATLPSMISKIAPPDLKGTAMGIYSTAQFLGAFVGGTGAGLLVGSYGSASVFIYCGTAALLWLLVAWGMKTPKHLTSRLENIRDIPKDRMPLLSETLLAVPGVIEAVVVPDDGVAYLKVDRLLMDDDALREALKAFRDAPKVPS
jgi:predicted MFS family arabinose efflux permease